MQADTREHELAALGFPLLLPDMPGYHATTADAASGALSGRRLGDELVRH
jgi:hypothetical protein